MIISRNFLYLGILTAGFVLLVVGCGSPKGNSENGSRWYKMYNCSSCHGPQGNDGKAPKISNIDIGFRTFRSIIRDAGSPIMPKYPETKIPDQDVADIYVWLKSK